MAQTNPILTEKQFKYNPELVAKYGTYKDYWSAQMKELRTTSAWTFSKNSYTEMLNERLEKHNAISQVLIERYEELEKVYNAMKKQENSIVGNLCGKYEARTEKDLKLALKEENSLTDQGKFNVAAKNSEEAYRNYISALSTANDWTHSNPYA